MAQFDVHRLKSDDTLVVDCQSELLGELNTRFIIPLIPKHLSPTPARRLNPVVSISGTEYVLVTQFAAAIERRELGEVIASLRDPAFEVAGALNILISGV